jgi:enterochelin esterase-like enzyme
MAQGIVKTLLWRYILFVLKPKRWYPICLVAIYSLLFLGFSFNVLAGDHPCCPEDAELFYFLSPKPSQRFQYLVQYEIFFSKELGREKGFFIILPEDFYQNPGAKYPVLFLLHGYNFERRGFWWKVYSPGKARKVLCEVKEEEYHWLVHEDIAIIAYATMDSRNRTYRDLERSLAERFEELSKYGGLAKEDYTPKEIAQSIVSHNLHPGRNLDDPFHPFQKMIILLPDGDNGFYTDENEGKRIFPETKNQRSCDAFNPGEALNYSLLPFLYMKPGALGKHESYFLEFLQYIESQSLYRERLLPKRGLGGVSVGGFGAIKLGLKYPHLFQSVSSQSGLLDIECLRDRLILKMVMPEFLEVFGRLEPQRLPSGSSLDLKHIQENNPLTLIKRMGISRLPHWLYFDYGHKEGFGGITKGNQNLENALKERSHQIPVQPFNGKSKHNNQFWRSRSGNMLRHHSDVFQKIQSKNNP